MAIQSWDIDSGEQTGGISPHALTHGLGGTDAISAEAIGAEIEGAAQEAIAGHLAEANPHPQYAEGSNGVTYNIIRSSPAFTEESDDFLSVNGFHKLGWGTSAQNGWVGAEQGNRFPGALGVFTLGIQGANQAAGNFAHLRLGNLPVRPLLSEGYSNIEMSAVVGLANFIPNSVDFSSRFGLLDSGAGDGEFGILICAEFHQGDYNWVAQYRNGNSSPVTRQTIGPVVGNLVTTLFRLKIRIDCEHFKILFAVDSTEIELVVGQSNWTFGATSPIFFVQRLAVQNNTQNRAFYADKFLFRKNVSDNEVPVVPGEVNWDSIQEKPDTATRWPTWLEVQDRPTFVLEIPLSATISFAAGYSNLSSSPVTCRRMGRLIVLQGAVVRTPTAGSLALTLSTGFSPINTQWFEQYTNSGNQRTVRVTVTSTGQLSIDDFAPAPTTNVTISLGGISYFVG
jgi:hypothetical protein